MELETSVRGLLEEVDDKVLKVASMVGGQTRPSNAPAVTVWASIGAHKEVLGNYTGDLAACWSTVNKGLEMKIADVLGEHGQVQLVVQTLVQMVTNLQARAEGPVTGMGSGSLVAEVEARAERAQLARWQEALANQLRALLEKSERQETALAALRAGQTVLHGYRGGAQDHGQSQMTCKSSGSCWVTSKMRWLGFKWTTPISGQPWTAKC